MTLTDLTLTNGGADSHHLPVHPLRLKQLSHKHYGKLPKPCTIFVAMPKTPLAIWQKFKFWQYVANMVLLSAFLILNQPWMWGIAIVAIVAYNFSYARVVLKSPYALPALWIGDCVAVPLLTIDDGDIDWQIAFNHTKQRVDFQDVHYFGADGNDFYVFDDTPKPPMVYKTETMTLLVLVDGAFYRVSAYELVRWFNDDLLAIKQAV